MVPGGHVDVIMNVLSWWCFGVVPGGHVDVIMKVLSWFGSQSFIREDVIMNVLSWWCSWFGGRGGHEDVINYSQ